MRIKKIKERLAFLDQEREELIKELQVLERETYQQRPKNKSQFSSKEKIDIFCKLFRGREDVYPKRWHNNKTGRSGYSLACKNEWVRGLCNKPKVKCRNCPNQKFSPITNKIIHKHLTDPNGTIGIYPLLKDETCWFLAADFDKEDWKSDVSAFLKTCYKNNVPAYIERSRSGNGGHVWIFFSQPISASDARKLGSYLLTETMEDYSNLSFTSYDRFFPNQDTMPVGGFGNLIALPLQYEPRKSDNSIFLNEKFHPYADQWKFLNSVKRMSIQEVNEIVVEAVNSGRVTGLHIPVQDENETEPWKVSPSRKPKPLEKAIDLPSSVQIVMGDQLYIRKKYLPPVLTNRLIRTAAFQNPEFYKAQAMRLSTFDKPRIIACAENFPEHLGLPRGCLDDVIELLENTDIKVDIADERNSGKPIKTRFLGNLNKEQKPAVKALMVNDTGVLSATTGFGKTVIAANIIAKRKRNTLILVHRKQLLEQWKARLETFLNLDNIRIGEIGGGKRKAKGQIDIALIQSLVRKGEVDDCVADYGQLIVDECHHLSAVSFEQVSRRCKAKYVLGLTATPIRKDGQQPIIFMQCGPVRYHVDAKKQAKKRPFEHYVVSRYTDFNLSLDLTHQYERPPIHLVYSELIESEKRNQMILEDVLQVLEEGRSPIILTERKEHIKYFAEKLIEKKIKNVLTLQGGMRKKEHTEILSKLDSIPENEERVLIATGAYIGEGFDDARLDTLFLAMPVSWKGTIAQYAGRLHRVHHNKTEVTIYDYIDYRVPVLKRMSEKRSKGYSSLGYNIKDGNKLLLKDAHKI